MWLLMALIQYELPGLIEWKFTPLAVRVLVSAGTAVAGCRGADSSWQGCCTRRANFARVCTTRSLTTLLFTRAAHSSSFLQSLSTAFFTLVGVLVFTTSNVKR
jgi:hypothetical protein